MPQTRQTNTDNKFFLGPKKTGAKKKFTSFDHIQHEDREFAANLIKKQLIEAKREAIYNRAKSALANAKKGKIKSGTVKDLWKDLEVLSI